MRFRKISVLSAQKNWGDNSSLVSNRTMFNLSNSSWLLFIQNSFAKALEPIWKQRRSPTPHHSVMSDSLQSKQRDDKRLNSRSETVPFKCHLEFTSNRVLQTRQSLFSLDANNDANKECDIQKQEKAFRASFSLSFCSIPRGEPLCHFAATHNNDSGEF